jgi:hypothetical protein
MKTTGSRLAGQAGRLIVRFAIVLAGLTACILAWAEDAPPPRLVFADETAVTASPDKNGKFAFDFTIKNAGGNADASGKPGEGALTLNHEMGKGCTNAQLAATPKAPIQLKSNAVTVVHVEITQAELPATCYVELSTTGPTGNTSVKQVKLNQQYVTSTFVTPLVRGLGISLAIVAITGLLCGGWGLRFGPPAWEFAKSWASTTTFAGGAFTTAVAFSVLPELTKYASKAGYAILSLLISLLVVVAPFVFSGLRDGEIKWDEKNHQYGVVYHGGFFFFWLSCALTLFAALAQLIVVFVVYREMFPDIDPWARDVPFYVMVGLGVVLCVYAILTIRLTIKLQTTENTDAPQRSARRRERFNEEMGNLAAFGINLDRARIDALVRESMKSDKPQPLPWPVL